MTDVPKDDADAPVKPQVIDLEAEDVTPAVDQPEADVEEPVPPPPPPPPRPWFERGTKPVLLVVALLIAAAAGAWLYRDLLSSYLPSDEMQSLRARVDTLETAAQTLNTQLTAVGGTADSLKEQSGQLTTAIGDATNAAKAARDQASALEPRLAATETAMGSAKADLESLRTAMSAGGTVAGTPDTAALAAMSQRIDALEKDLAILKAGPGTSDSTSAAAALSQALADIKAKIAAGTAYGEELDRIVRMVPAAAGLELLSQHAADGLPNAQGLGAELRAAIPTLPKASAEPPPQAGGYWDSIRGALASIVKIREIGEADWALLAERCASLAEGGDLAQAIGLIDAAEGAKPVALSQWRDRAAERLRLEAALAEAAQAVQRQVSALGDGQ